MKVAYWLLCCEQERYVGEAVRSALAQDYSPLEILVSDDCSADRTFDIAAAEVAAYRGPHTVRLNRNPRNLAAAHYDRLAGMTDAELIVIAHGDDVAAPQRTRRLAGALAEPGIFMASSNAMVIDGAGAEQKLFAKRPADERIEAEEIIDTVWRSNRLGAALAMRRGVMSEFPPLGRLASPMGIDIILPLRASLLGSVRYLAEPLLRYRRHGANASDHFGKLHAEGNVGREATGCYLLRALHKCLDDVIAYRAAHSGDARIRTLHANLVAKIVRTSGDWARLQNELILGGRRPQWIEQTATGRK